MLPNPEGWAGLITAAAALIAAVGGGAWWAERRAPKAKSSTDNLAEVLRDEFEKTREAYEKNAREQRDLLIKIETRLEVQGRS